MGSITIQFSDEADQAVFVDLLARAIQQATAEPLGILVSALRGGALIATSEGVATLGESLGVGNASSP